MRSQDPNTADEQRQAVLVMITPRNVFITCSHAARCYNKRARESWGGYPFLGITSINSSSSSSVPRPYFSRLLLSLFYYEPLASWAQYATTRCFGPFPSLFFSGSVTCAPPLAYAPLRKTKGSIC